MKNKLVQMFLAIMDKYMSDRRYEIASLILSSEQDSEYTAAAMINEYASENSANPYKFLLVITVTAWDKHVTVCITRDVCSGYATMSPEYNKIAESYMYGDE